jgi:preprotein translocase subunit SecD
MGKYAAVHMRWFGLLVLMAMLTGCGAIYDSLVPPPPDERQNIAFYFAQDQYRQGLVMRAARGGTPKVYAQQTPIVQGTDIQRAVPMKDAAGYFFVGIQLNDSGARKLAQASPKMIGKQLALVVDGQLIGAALIDAPIDKGTFAMATSNKNAAFALSDLLSPKAP